MWAVLDPEMARENPVEDKHRRLVRSHRSSPYDRELKPNAKIRDELGVSNAPYFHAPLTDVVTLGNPELPTFTTSHFRRKGFDLEVPFLSRKRQAWIDQVPQVGDLERSLGGQTGGGRVIANVDGG